MKRCAIVFAALCAHCAHGAFLRKSLLGTIALDSDSVDPYVLDRCTEIKEIFGGVKFTGKEPMTLKVCYTFCASRKAFYFGVSKGNKCWCGSQYQARISGSSVCNAKCAGNSNEYCGGKYAHSVYIMGKGPCDEKPKKEAGDSADKDLGQAEAALGKAVKQAKAIVNKGNKKLELKGGKLVDQAKHLVAEAMSDVEGKKPKKGAAKRKLKQAKNKVNVARKIFRKMDSFGSGRTAREKQVRKDLAKAVKVLGTASADVASVKKANDQLNKAAAKPPPQRGIEKLGVKGFTSFEFMGLNNVYFRHSSFKMEADPIPKGKVDVDLYKKDATFEFMPPLLTSADGGVSIRSKYYPDRYLRHTNFRMVLDQPTNNNLFQRDSTFFFVRPNDNKLAAAGAHLLRSENFPDRYIHVRGDGHIYLDTLGEAGRNGEAEFAFKLSAPFCKVEKDCPDVKPCEMWDFVGLPNSDLMAIKMGPTTGTKKTEVHTLGKGSNYKSWVLQTGTGLQLTDASHGTEWDFAAMPNGDLMSIMMGPKTGSGKTEVHILSKSSNYAKFALHAATGLGLSTKKEWDFVAAPNGDLMCIKKGPTGSKKTEVHILSKSSNYAKFNLHAATGLQLSNGGTEWDFAAMPNGDLMCIMMGPKTGSGKTEVHILSKSSNYKKFVLHAATGLQLSNHKQWSFATLPNGDLMCILKGPTTGSKKTEVHVLSKSSNYKNWALQTGTGLALTLDKPGTCSS